MLLLSLTALASLWSNGNGKPGSRGMRMQARHGVPSWCARIIRFTRALPIWFSIFVSPTVVLSTQLDNTRARTSYLNIRCDEELILHVDKVLRHLNGWELRNHQLQALA